MFANQDASRKRRKIFHNRFKSKKFRLSVSRIADSRSLIEAVAVPAVRGTQAVAAIVPAAGVAAEPAGCTVQDVEKKVMVY